MMVVAAARRWQWALRTRTFSTVGSFKQQAATRENDELWKMLESGTDSLQAVETWTAKGNEITIPLTIQMQQWLNNQKRRGEIHKLLTGIREKNLTELTEKHCMMEMEALCRLDKSRAEALCNALPEHLRTDAVIGQLILTLGRENALAKAEVWLEKMKQPSVKAFRTLMALYLRRDRHQKVLATYKRLQALEMEPDVQTYRILLELKDRVGGLEGIEQGAKAAADRITRGDLVPVKTVAMLVYGYLQDVEGLDRIWKEMQAKEKKCKPGYQTGITAYSLAGKVAEAEQLFKDLMSQGHTVFDINPYALMIEGYVRNGLMNEAERMLRRRLNEPIFEPYNSIIRGYIESNRLDLAVERFDEGILASSPKSIKMQYKTIMGLLQVFAMTRNLRAAERAMYFYPSLGDAAVYNELLKVYAACNRCPKSFRARLEGHGVEPNEETEALLDMVKDAPISADSSSRWAKTMRLARPSGSTD